MKQSIFLLALAIQSLTALSQDVARNKITMKRIDSTLHAAKEYKKVVKDISAIPDSIKTDMVMTIDSGDKKENIIFDKNGNPIPKNKLRYSVGYKKSGAASPTYIWHVWYLYNQNKIVHVSKKPTWEHATDLFY
jgi:hypothetical protein